MFSYASSKTADQHPLASFRTPIEGPELRIVEAFCNDLHANAASDVATTVFVEPKIFGCFPDLVIVEWDPDIVTMWSDGREQLEAGDTYWLHYLHQLGELERATICERQGNKRGTLTWDRLVEANIATLKGDRLCSRPLSEVYAVKRLVAVEAKIGNWRRGLEQAFQNTWFASESFLLLDQLNGRNELFLRASELGLGLLEPGASLNECPLLPKRGAHPLSQASWLFNESVWRTSIPSESRH
ncbi:hypothetical protein [Cupriavidus sp. SS-3]|uniref:hypothetical protein n=1 Tax=Cupriavidus sp. SS-3 TaxID=3109596 RepID=UPI002DB750DF|nr:hypothetical protein [Cupriavidus sp. SS-3]MEC3766892.1 hypothetical protein [Cupriavidus sp. SS-3]